MTRSTLLDAKNSTIPAAVGLPACDPRFTQLVNEAQQRIWNAGRYVGSIAKFRVCIIDGCIVWPREIMTIEGFNLCRYSIPIRNIWYEFQENVFAPKAARCSCAQSQLLDRNHSPVIRAIAAPSYIRCYPQSATDVGKRILFQGTDPNGNVIRTLDGDTWVDGEYITLAYPFATSTNLFEKDITGVQKDLTNQNVVVYSVAQESGLETLLANYQPSETKPWYRRSFLINLPRICNDGSCATWTSCCRDNGDGCTGRDIDCTNVVCEVLARLEFIPALVDTDWLMVGNVQALKRAIISNQRQDDNQFELAESNWQECLRLLRDEQAAESPPERAVINVEVMGTAPMRRLFNGFI